MTLRVVPMDEREVTALHQPRQPVANARRGSARCRPSGATCRWRASTPRSRITGLVGRIELTQGFHNPHDVPLEATYIFPLPDRAAVTAMTHDRRRPHRPGGAARSGPAAREQYDQAIAAGQRAAIAEEERPDVFTMRVGNILPGERVTVALTLVGPLSYEDGEATFRFPLVVAPRYIPGAPLRDRGRRRVRARHRRRARRLADHAAGAAARLPEPGAALASASTSTRPACRWPRSGRACTPVRRREGEPPVEHPAGRAGRPRLHPATGLWGARRRRRRR